MTEKAQKVQTFLFTLFTLFFVGIEVVKYAVKPDWADYQKKIEKPEIDTQKYALKYDEDTQVFEKEWTYLFLPTFGFIWSCIFLIFGLYFMSLFHIVGASFFGSICLVLMGIHFNYINEDTGLILIGTFVGAMILLIISYGVYYIFSKK